MNKRVAIALVLFQLLAFFPASGSSNFGASANKNESPFSFKRSGLQDPNPDTTKYKVVVNNEEQYSIWPADRENQPGWNDAGKTGTKAECLAYIEELWKGMRAPRIPATDDKAPTADDFRLPGLGQSGRAIEIIGPFDANFSNTEITIGGKTIQPLAESSKSCFFISPTEGVGPSEIKLRERGAEAQRTFRNLGVNLTAPKTSLLKGEKTTVTIEVSGLQGLQQNLPLQLSSTGVINMQGGNFQKLSIQPRDVQAGGKFTTTRGITGLTAGGFAVIATVTDSERGSTVEPNPTVMVWTTLTLDDIKSCLQEGGNVEPQGKGYLVKSIRNPVAFAVRLGILSHDQNVQVPRFGRQGQGDPGPPSNEMQALGLAFSSVVANIIQGAANNFGGPWPNAPWPNGPLPNPQRVAAALQRAGFQLQGGQFPPKPKGPGRWVLICPPAPPCVRPQEPTAQDIPRCDDEKRELNRVERWLELYNDSIKTGEELLAGYEKADSISSAVDVTVAVLTLVAIATGPVAFGVGSAFVIAATGFQIDMLQGLLLDLGLHAAIAHVKSQLAKLQLEKALFEKALAEALAALEACLKKAADVEAANAAAWQNYFNVLLPEYYKCLAARRCRRVWVPR